MSVVEYKKHWCSYTVSFKIIKNIKSPMGRSARMVGACHQPLCAHFGQLQYPRAVAWLYLNFQIRRYVPWDQVVITLSPHQQL